MAIKNNIRPLIFGEALFDQFPDGSRIIGGAPFNVAWHLQAFGHSPLFISRVGNDRPGEEIRTAMQEWGMDISGLQSDPVHATGSVEVSFLEGSPRYEIVQQRAYDFIDEAELPVIMGKTLLYHGSLALRHDISARALAEVCRRTNAPLFVDINLRSPWWNMKSVQQMLGKARWIKLNEEELRLIMPGTIDDKQLLSILLTDQTEFVALTRGEKGASIISDSGTYDVNPQSSLTIVDTVGAGDAFCSVLLTGIIWKWPLSLTIERAQQFASAVVGIRGAISNDRYFYENLIDTWKD
jgi:fructokinase